MKNILSTERYLSSYVLHTHTHTQKGTLKRQMQIRKAQICIEIEKLANDEIEKISRA